LFRTIDIGKFDLLDQKIDKRAIVAFACRFATVAQEIGEE
jgi:hypothetical protein